MTFLNMPLICCTTSVDFVDYAAQHRAVTFHRNTDDEKNEKTAKEAYDVSPVTAE